VLAASSSTPSRPAPEVAPAAARAPTVGPAALDGERWLRGTRTALDDPKQVRVPFAGLGDLVAADGGATVFAFEALGGQTLEVTLAFDAVASGDSIYVEVFRVVDVLGEVLHQRLTALPPGASRLRTRLPSDGDYHVLVQTGPSGGGRYHVTLELAAGLPFPVVGGERNSIRGLFGASRDSGRRYHEGVDIFVQRLTPVLAVAAGHAIARNDALGGNTVWLDTPGTSYYYAHLDRVAVRDRQDVKVGDVLGYVGNTGNADSTPSHLHFGVYRWGTEPIDPLPLLVGQRFDGKPAASTAGAGG
jgi:murein DD-endopeptidase MepM/ murein hydrolase activator NlpD